MIFSQRFWAIKSYSEKKNRKQVWLFREAEPSSRTLRSALLEILPGATNPLARMFFIIFCFEIICCQKNLELGNSKNHQKTAKNWEFLSEISNVESLQRYHRKCNKVYVELTVCPSQKIPQTVLCVIFVSCVVVEKQQFFVPDFIKNFRFFLLRFWKHLTQKKTSYIFWNLQTWWSECFRFRPTTRFSI